MGAQPLNPAQKQALDKALKIAVNSSDLDMMTNAVIAGADANIMMFQGVANKQLEWVKAAIDHGANPNAQMAGIEAGDAIQYNKPYPVFFWLSRSFSAEIGDYLLSKGANIDAMGEGNSALMAAVMLQDKQSVRFLVERGADPLLTCADQNFPLKHMEDNDWYDRSARVPLIKTMMENLKKRAETSATAVAANDVSAQTGEAIEINHPIELKRKPKARFEL